MVTSGESGNAPTTTTGSAVGRYARYAGAWTAGAVPVFAVAVALWLYPAEFAGVGELSLGAFALMFPIGVRQFAVPRRTEFVHFLLGVGLAFGVVSILTGAANGLTNEPYALPRFLGLLLAHRDPYVTPLTFQYVQYGRTIPYSGVYPFLPLLLLLQLPVVGYKWFALAAWAATVLVVRRRFDVAVMLAQPYVVLVAANGFTDPIVLLFLTLAFVGVNGRRQKWAEWLSLGLKQFANLFVLAYYALRRDWRNLAVTAGVSVAFLVPFLLWSGSGVLCPAVVSNHLPACGSGFPPAFQLNYPVYLVWAVAVFYPALLAAVRRRCALPPLRGLLARLRLTPDELVRIPPFLVVGVSGVFVNLAVFVLFGVHFGTAGGRVFLASAAAFAGALGWNFSWNRAWAFQGRGGRSTAYHFLAYGLIQLGALAVNEAGLAAGVALGLSSLEGQVAGIVLGSGIAYAANLRWNFTAPAPSAPSG